MNPQPQQQYGQGERVRYMNQQGATCQGTIQVVEGSGLGLKYVIKNESNNQTEQVQHSSVEGRL
jgi:hypothetical protein